MYLSNGEFIELEDKREVVGNATLFKMSFGLGKWMKYVKVMPGLTSVDFSYRNPTLPFLTSDELGAFLEES